MKYLGKSRDQDFKGLSYPKDGPEIRQLLLEEQKGYCAYSEKYLDPIDAQDIEHFDPRKKHIARMESIKNLCPNQEEFLQTLQSNPEFRSYATALEAHFGIKFV